MAMKAEEALAIAKSYTKKSLIGQGAIQGQDGKTPYIDPTTKHWFIDGVDTGVLAEGVQGQQGISPTIDPVSKHWMIGTIDTGVVAEGVNGIDGTDGTDGVDGVDGFSPTVVVNPLNTTSDYRLDITTIGGTFTTPNLIGAQGQQGIPGTSAVSAINPRGDYDVNATPNYTTNDYVTYTDGNTYVCKVDNPTNIAPTDGRNNDPFWQIIALRGADGVQGADGQPGVDGTTFIPSIDVNGNVSWTNNGGLANPTTVNVKGADGITYTPKIGTVTNTTTASASVTVNATTQEATFDFGLPEGQKGDKGDDGNAITSVTTDSNNNIIATFTDGTTKVLGQLNTNIQADFLTSGGFGNLRYYNGKFQYYDTVNSVWVDTSVSPQNLYVLEMIPQAMKSISGMYDIDLGFNKLKWEEPEDTVLDGQTFVLVEKVVIRRKLGVAPTDETDGELVIEVPRSAFGTYKDVWYVDEGFAPNNGETWYYKAFPISTNGFANISSVNECSIFCKDYYLFGFKIDQNESDPSSMITYLSDCDNSGYKSAYMDYSTGLFNYGDWGNAWFIRDLKPCMLNFDGTVAYELDKNDYSLKADGTASDIANVSFGGNAMMGIPKTYWKIVDNGDDTANVYFTNKKIDNDFVCWTHIDNNGNEIDYCYMAIYEGYFDGIRLRSISGIRPTHSRPISEFMGLALENNISGDEIWQAGLFCDLQLLSLLLLLIGKSTDTQHVFGWGNSYNGNSEAYSHSSGELNNKGLFWGMNNNAIGVKVFGIEHPWGNKWKNSFGWISYYGEQKIKLTYGQSDGSTVDGYNFDGTGYISTGIKTNSQNGYTTKMAFVNNCMMPIAVGGSGTTYYPDIYEVDDTIIAVGGHSGSNLSGAMNGAFCRDAYSTSDRYYWYSAEVISCKPLAN